MSAAHGQGVSEAPSLARQVDELREAIVAELARRGLSLSASDATALAESVMARAVRLALQWVEEGEDSVWTSNAP